MLIKDLYYQSLFTRKVETEQLRAKSEKMLERLKTDAKKRAYDEKIELDEMLKTWEALYSGIVKKYPSLDKSLSIIESVRFKAKKNETYFHPNRMEECRKIIHCLKFAEILNYNFTNIVQLLAGLVKDSRYSALIKSIPDQPLTTNQIDDILKPFKKEIPFIIQKNDLEIKAITHFSKAKMKCFTMENQLPVTLIEQLKYFPESYLESEIIDAESIEEYAALLEHYADFHNAFVKDQPPSLINQTALSVLMQFEDFMVSTSYHVINRPKEEQRLIPIIANIFKHATLIVNDPNNSTHALNLAAYNRLFQDEFTQYKYLSTKCAPLRHAISLISLLAYLSLLLISLILPTALTSTTMFFALKSSLAVFPSANTAFSLFLKERSLINSNIEGKVEKLDALEITAKASSYRV